MEQETIGLTIFLLKSDQVTSFEDKILRGQNAVALSEPLDGVFLPLPSTPHQPAWVPAVRSILRNPESLSLPAQSPAGLLVVRRSERTFVITFGHAWQRLESGWIERDFGRRVALNSIARDKVLEIRAEQVFAKWHLANERAPRASSVDEFGVEFDRDLVGTMEGVPSQSDLGKTLRGGTNLRLSLALSQLEAVLDKSKTLFESTAYKKIWPEIDNISPVRDQILIGGLEAELDTEFQSGQAQRKIVMFTPTHRRDETWAAESYVFGRMSQNPPMTPYLTINAWINFLARHGRIPSVAEAKATPVHLLDEAKEEVNVCTAFECFGCELSLDGKQYILSSGVWYEVVPEFLARINREINKIPQPRVSLPAWDQVESEGAYNLRCARNKAFLHFDDNAKQILMGGGHSKFEFCDLLHLGRKTLFFAKIASKSSGMSHLVEQVRRTAELFFSTDATYRQKLGRIFTKHYSDVDGAWLTSRPRNGDWTLCFVSLGRSARQLPFFAKCSLAKVYKDLRERGHDVCFIAV